MRALEAQQPAGAGALPADASFMPNVEEEEPGRSPLVIPPLPSWGDEKPLLVPRLWPGSPISPDSGTGPAPIKFEAEIQLPPEVDPTILPEIHLPDYFAALPDTHLVDPQTLLTGDERTNVNLALKQHLTLHKIPVYILLFQKEQKIPDFQNLDTLQERWFGDQPGVIVAFWLGSPTRTSAHFGSRLREQYGDQIDQAFAKALGQSYTKTYPFSQLDHFTYTLLWRFSQLEEGATSQSRNAQGLVGRDPLTVPELPEIPKTRWLPVAARSSALAIGVAALGAGIIAKRRRRERVQAQPEPVLLPAENRAVRLNAPHCGGSGAFIKVSEPPTKIPS